MLEWLSECALINHNLESVSFEQKEEFFSSLASHNLLLSHHFLTLVCPLLQVSSLRLVSPSFASSLHSLCLNKLCFLHLQEKFLVLGQLLLFEVFD